VDKILNRLHGQVQSRPDKERPYPAKKRIERPGQIDCHGVVRRQSFDCITLRARLQTLWRAWIRWH